MSPEEIPVGAYTHLNFAFAFVDPSTFAIAPMDQNQIDLYKRTTRLKEMNPGMEVWISIGGWSMNDPDQATHGTFSALAASKDAQSKFFNSVVSFMQNYGFDGVDIDWEYPVAPERSGDVADYDNYVTFLQNLRRALGASGHKYGLSITIPSSYWYLKNFDIVNIAKSIDWFNMMSYDLHGTWDSTDQWIGAIVQAHTNLTEIDLALQLLWRNNIDPAQVVLGLGFYGRTFTLSDPSCSSPGCSFSGGGNAGDCTNNVGTLSYDEIQRVIAGGATVTLNKDAAVKQVVWDRNQWTSYDDADTLSMKVDYANKHCLGGTMVWAVSLDKMGAAAAALSKRTGRQALARSDRSDPYKASGVCYITSCNKAPTCPSGYGAVQQVNGNKQDVKIEHGCGKGQKRTYCCPSDDMPTCRWKGSAPACDIKNGCDSDEFGLTYDTGGGCTSGHKNLCCKTKVSDQAATQCIWKGSAPRCERDNKCPSDKPKEIARSVSGDNQQECDVYGFGDAQTKQLKVFCCTDPPPYTGCDWYTKGAQDPPPSPRPAHCTGSCPSGKVLIATDDMCFTGGTRAFCCDPAHTYNDQYITGFKNKLLAFSDDPTCPAAELHGPIHAKRDTVDEPTEGKLETRDFDKMGGYDTLQVLYTSLALGTQVSNLIVQAYNEVIGKQINLLAPAGLQKGINLDPYNNPLFDMAWMLCGWNKAASFVNDGDDSAEVCVLPPNDYDFSGVEPDGDSDDPTKRKRDIVLREGSKVDFEGIEGHDEHQQASFNISKRIFGQDNAATGRAPGGLPPTGLLMRAIIDDGLPLLYMRHIRYQANDVNNQNRDTILEIVYDLTNRPDLQFITQGTEAGPWREDRFAVFHFHTVGLQTGTNGESDYPLIPFFHAFHAQTVEPEAHGRPEYVVVQSNVATGAANGGGRVPGPNARSEVLQCGRTGQQGSRGQRLTWIPGQAPSRLLPPMAQTINDFGTFLRREGVLVGDNFPHWDGQRQQWQWDANRNGADFYDSASFGPIEQGVRQPAANMNPSNGWPG